MRVYKPSRLVRWPLHMLNVLLFMVIGCLLGSIAIFRKLEQEPLWSLVFVGGGICLFFVLLNLAVTGMRLKIDDEGVSLRVWFWRRFIPWTSMRVEKEQKHVGLTAVRLFADDGKSKLYLNPAWFVGFDEAIARIEERALDADGTVEETAG